MTHSLGERQEEYESNYDFTLMRSVPIVIRSTLQNHKRLIQNVDTFSTDFSDVMMQTLMYVISQVQDAVFGYYYNDELSIILKNDKELDNQPWNGNNIQRIASIISSYCTNGFIKSVGIFGENLDLSGDPLFKTKVWAVPNNSEAANYLVSRQGNCIKNAINTSCYFELENKFGKLKAAELFKDSSYEEKKEMLLHYCGIDFFDYYSSIFIYGGAIYKVPVIVPDKETKNKWFADDEIPNFINDRDFVLAIIANGVDVYRAPDILKLKEKT